MTASLNIHHSNLYSRKGGYLVLFVFLICQNIRSQNNLIFYGGNGGGNSMTCMSLPVVLPIELVSFDCKCDDKFVMVNWKTASEHNTKSFDIEFSTNAVLWEKITETPAAGTSLQLKQYSVALSMRPKTLAYLRLKIIDLDGAIEVSKIIALYPCQALNLKVYPNPSSDSLNIEFNEVISYGEVKIYSMIGELVYSSDFSNVNYLNLNIDRIVAGCYFITILRNSEVYHVLKWVKLSRKSG